MADLSVWRHDNLKNSSTTIDSHPFRTMPIGPHIPEKQIYISKLANPSSSREPTANRFTIRPVWVKIPVHPCPKTVDSPNTVLQKITGGIFCTQFVQCNDGGAGDKCMFLSVLTYSSNPLTQICEIVQLTRWAHRKFPQHFLPSSRHKKQGECLLLLLACKFRRSQRLNLKLWLFHVIGVKRYREAESVHWGSETVYVSSPAKLHDVFEFQHSGWFPPPAPKRPLWHRRVETFEIKYLHSFEPFCWWHLPFASHAFPIF